MSLQSFKLPAPDSRLVIHNGVIYKVTLSYKYAKANAFLPCAPGVMQREVEAALRAILHKDNRLEPLKIKTAHFLIDSKLEPWPACKKLVFEENGEEVPACVDKIVLTVQPRPGRRSSVGYKTLHAAQNCSLDEGTSKTESKQNRAHSTTRETVGPRSTRKSLEKENVMPKRNNGKSDVKKTLETSTNAAKTSVSEKANLSVRNRINDTNLRPEKFTTTSTPDVFVSKVTPRNHNSIQNKTKDMKEDEISEVESENSEVNEMKTPLVKDMRTSKQRKIYQSKGNIEALCETIEETPFIQQTVHSESQESDDSSTTTHSLGKNTKQKRATTVRKVRSTRNRRSYAVETTTTESESTDEENVQSRSNESAPQPSKRYSFRRRQNEKAAVPKASSKNVNTRSKKTNTVTRSAGSGGGVNQAIPSHDNTSSVRRSKRLKSLAQDSKSTPAKKRKLQDNRSISKGSAQQSTSGVNTGTQTQGSTFRIKNADMKLLKKLAVPAKKLDSDVSGKRPKRVLTSHPSSGEDIGTRSTNKEALCYQRDRTLIQQEELAEEMKLQQMAVATNGNKPVATVAKGGQEKKRSLIMSTLGNFLTPVKNLFK